MTQSVTRPAGGAITDVDQKPLITAILVTRNKESFIRESLSDLMQQTMADRMEVIVVDPGSEQSEWSVVADLQRRFHNLIAVKTAPMATGAALNLALKIASGRYLTVIEAGDRLRGEAYQILATALDTEPEAMLAYGDTCFTTVAHESFANHTSYGKMVWPDYTFQQLSQLPQVAPHPMWRRVVNDAVGGFDERHESQAMRDFLLKVSGRFRMLHVSQFTGLQLVAPGTQLNQESASVELAPPGQNYQETMTLHAAPAAAPAVASAAAASTRFSAPVGFEPAVALNAEEAYTQLEQELNGAPDQQAAEALARHLERYPMHAVAHNDFAAYSYRLGNPEVASRHYRRAIELEPTDSTFRKNLADLCFVEGEVEEAISIYLELFKASPRDIETLMNLGIISEEIGQTEEAESFYQRALEIEPWNQEVRRRVTEMRARVAESAQDDEEALPDELYEQAQELVGKGDIKAAEGKLQRIVDLFPDFAPAYNDLAVIHYQNGEKEKAVALYEQAAALAPGNSTFQKNLADIYFVEGRDVDGAIGIYLKLLEKEPRNIETLMNLGRICAVLDRPEEAKSFYGKVTQLEPWNRDARECLTSLRNCVNG